MTIEHRVDLVELIRAAGTDGLSAQAVARSTSEKAKPSRADVEKARRQLEKLVVAGVLLRTGGAKGGSNGGQPAAYLLRSADHGRSQYSSKPQVMDGHAPNTSITEGCVSAGRGDHATTRIGHADADHVSTPPFEGRGT